MNEGRGPQATATMDTLPWRAVLPGSTHVELRFPIRRGDDRTSLRALFAQPLRADVRQVTFLETDDLALTRLGVTVRATRSPHGRADVVVGVRLERHRDAVTRSIRESGIPGGLEVDVEVGPQGEVPWCLLTTRVTEPRLRGLLNGRLDLVDVLQVPQSRLLETCLGTTVYPGGALHPLPPVRVLRRSYLPPGYSRRLQAESWFPPDGARRLALVTRCRPSSAPEVVNETRRFLSARGIRLEGDNAWTTTEVALLAAWSPLGRS